MHIRPILSALSRHRASTLLIALEIALACAVLCNACFLIIQRLDNMRIDSGVDEASLAVVRLDGYSDQPANDLNARMLAGLRAIPGVESVAVINAVPFGQQAGAAGIFLDAENEHFGGVVDFYVGSPGSLETLGLRVVAGRAPQAADYQPVSNFVPEDAQVLVTRALAEQLWPGADPLGREFWLSGDRHFRVMGVLDHLAIARPGGRGAHSAEWSVFVPAQPGPQLLGNYVLRAAPGDLPRVMRAARETVARVAPTVVLDEEQTATLGELRERYFRSDRAMAGLLVGTIVALLLVTALGIVGLTSFWVSQRRRQIGVRRALGATRGDILRYFQTENFLIVSAGIVMGMLLAYGLNQGLMQQYELARLPAFYLPVGAIVLWLLGQVAVLAPARRATRVSPAEATRSI
ncbi:ABC transporter permease [Luteimonas soli]|uniref:ABC transporter permease n=1 Tax=Luteimonas soli TaxID=1648966 RepID=A0ABV7XHA0_9GAMM